MHPTASNERFLPPRNEFNARHGELATGPNARTRARFEAACARAPRSCKAVLPPRPPQPSSAHAGPGAPGGESCCYNVLNR